RQDGNDDQTGAPRRREDDEDLGQVGHHEDDAVARRAAEVDEPAREPLARVVKLAVRVRPLLVDEALVDAVFGEVLLRELGQVHRALRVTRGAYTGAPPPARTAAHTASFRPETIDSSGAQAKMRPRVARSERPSASDKLVVREPAAIEKAMVDHAIGPQ